MQFMLYLHRVKFDVSTYIQIRPLYIKRTILNKIRLIQTLEFRIDDVALSLSLFLPAGDPVTGYLPTNN